jgi:cyclopropane fatty-acyl-phospholipid synthase-like methyltransferase
LEDLGEEFDTILDCGLFHIFDDSDRAAYVKSLQSVLVAGGRYHMLCFSDSQPGEAGPRRVGEAEIRSSFGDAWRVDEIVPATMEITIPGETIRAWRASLTCL